MSSPGAKLHNSSHQSGLYLVTVWSCLASTPQSRTVVSDHPQGLLSLQNLGLQMLTSLALTSQSRTMMSGCLRQPQGFRVWDAEPDVKNDCDAADLASSNFISCNLSLPLCNNSTEVC